MSRVIIFFTIPYTDLLLLVAQQNHVLLCTYIKRETIGLNAQIKFQ